MKSVAVFLALMVVGFGVSGCGRQSSSPAPVPDPSSGSRSPEVTLFPGEVVEVAYALSHAYIPAGRDADVFLQFRLAADEATRQADRLPLNLAAVLDKSGSMSGDKIEKVKEATTFVVNHLDPHDFFALVVYDSEVQVLQPAIQIGEADKEILLSRIGQLGPGSNTNLSGGLFAGIGEVGKNRSDQRINRVLLLSDGLANEGITDRFALRDKAASHAKEGIQVSTLGVGLDYNEDLMEDLAKFGGGNYYFIAQPEEIAQIFEQELSGLMQVVARDVEIIVEPAEGVTVENPYGYQVRLEGKKFILTPKDLSANEARDMLLQLHVPAQSVGNQTLARVTARYRDVDRAEGELREAQVAATVEATEDVALVEANANREVLASVELNEAMAANTQAVKMYEAGQQDEAARFYQDKVAAARAATERYRGTRAANKLAAEMAQMESQAKMMGSQAAAAAPLGKAARKEMMYQRYQVQEGKK